MHRGGPADRLLAAVPLFSGLDDKALTRLARDVEELDAASPTTLYKKGERADRLYVVMSGRVKLAAPAPDGSEKVISLLRSGEVFGEAAMFLDEPHIVSAETIGPARIVQVTRAGVLALMKRDSEFALRIAVRLSGRLHQLVRELEGYALHSGKQRVVNFLLSEIPQGEVGRTVIRLPAKKRVIASRLDLTHEHFSRILRDLATANVILVAGSKIEIPDVGRLRGYADT